MFRFSRLMVIRNIIFIFVIFLNIACNKNTKDSGKAIKGQDNEKCDLVSYCDPFLGSTFGNIYVGTALPNSMVKLGPDVVVPQSTNGYLHNKPLFGFSHTHLSGTGGGGRYGNIALRPYAGNYVPNKKLALGRRNERAYPGYYTVELGNDSGDVVVELTSAVDVGLAKFSFFTWNKAKVFNATIEVNLWHTITRGGSNDARCTGSELTVDLPANAIYGSSSYQGGWGGQNPYTIYFYTSFDKTMQTVGVSENGVTTSLEGKNKATYKLQGDFSKLLAFVTYKLEQHQTVEVRTGISYKDVATAKNNLQNSNQKLFSQYRVDAHQAWNNLFQKIKVEGENPEQKKIFYSCLRNVFLLPTNVSGQLKEWPKNKPAYWEHYCIWDVFRTAMPLYTLIKPELQTEVLNNLLTIYEDKGWLPDSWVAGHYADVQGGSNADVVFADAIVKNLGGFDQQLAYEAIKKNGTVNSPNPKNFGRHLNRYRKLGYLDSSIICGSSKSLEYAYNDYCIGAVAQKLGDTTTANMFFKLSDNCFKLFHPEHKFFWAKDSLGQWEDNFSPTHSVPGVPSWFGPYFYEATPWKYSTYVPHNMAGLIERMGGNSAFIAHLDTMFETNNFDLENEPVFLVPYQYIYANKHDNTAYRVHEIIRTEYGVGERGLPGQDDSGAMSSWFVFSSTGIFPVAGQPYYLIGSPLFKKSVWTVGHNQKTFTIIAPNAGHGNIYVKSAKLNGKSLNRAWLNHSEVVNGGTLELEMIDTPQNWDANFEVPFSVKY